MDNFSGYNEPRNIGSSAVPTIIKSLFQPQTDIPKIFEWMENRYHLHPDWHKQFKEDLTKIHHELPEQEFFFIWATHNLNHILQTIVRRKRNIIEEIAIHLLREKIAEKARKEKERRNVYKKGI